MPRVARDDAGDSLGVAGMTLAGFCAAAVERMAPGGLGENLAGDLIEDYEDARTRLGDRAAVRWLARHAAWTCWESLRIRSRQGNWLERAAAAAFLVALPLSAAIALRRYALTLVPFRESAEFGLPALAAAALSCAGLAALAVRSRAGSRAGCVLAAMFAAGAGDLGAVEVLLAGASAWTGAAAARASIRGGDVR